MDLSEHEFPSIDVGSRLKQLRTERGKSMRSLARSSGLSTNALSMIERGKTSPSVSTLYKIAEAMEVPITAFFREDPPRRDIVCRRATERRRINISNGIWEGLGGEAFIGHVEPFMLTLEPGSGSGPFGMIHSGHEFVYVLSGRLDYVVEEQAFSLEEGDSLIFAAQLRHRWQNNGQDAASVIIVLSGFEPGERPSEYHLSGGKKDAEEGDDSASLDEEIIEDSEQS